MPAYPWPRVAGVVGGLLLVLYSAAEMYAIKSGYRGEFVRAFCGAGFCPEEFTIGRRFLFRRQLLLRRDPKLLNELQRALRFDTADAYRWADLGDAEAAMEQSDKARYCFEQAVARAPRSPAILFRAANFAFAAGDPADVLKDLRRVLEQPELAGYYASIFLTYMRLGVPVDSILAQGVPAMRVPVAEFLRYVENRNDVAAANTMWEWMTRRKLEDDASTADYLGLLIRNRQTESAAHIWKGYAGADSSYLESTWVYNGSFEKPLRRSPFDWIIQPTAHVQAGLAQGGAFDGSKCVRLDFLGGANMDYRGVYELAAVTPGEWKLTAHLRTDQITTDQGISLHVIDIRNGAALDAWSQMLTGTHPWTEVQVQFTVRPGTDVVRVDVVRRQSLHFDNEIMGTAWVDAVRLEPLRRG